MTDEIEPVKTPAMQSKFISWAIYTAVSMPLLWIVWGGGVAFFGSLAISQIALILGIWFRGR